jgi:hypothetical protein
MKPPKNILKRRDSDGELVDDAGTLTFWKFHEAVRFYEKGWIRACDICGEVFLDARSREDEFVTDFDKENFGTTEGGREICYECGRSPKKVASLKNPSTEAVPPEIQKDGKACPFCEGKAVLPCVPCDGSGWLGCNSCAARGGDPCSMCDGKGNVRRRCKQCNGKGTAGGRLGALFDMKCKSCDGSMTKWATCSSCEGTGRQGECRKCGRTGEMDCPNCSGSGKLPCPECKGYGRPIPKVAP